MSDLEFFGGGDASESFDPAAFDRFKERMKASAAQLQASAKQEKHHKKSEDELIKILLKFIQGDEKREILLLVLRLLELNIPAGFLVSLLMISHEEIQKELNIFLLPAGNPAGADDTTRGTADAAPTATGSASSEPLQNPNLPEIFIGEKVLPLKMKITIGNWINEIQRRINDEPQKILKTATDENGLVVLAAIQLGTFCLRDYLEKNSMNMEYDQLKEFVDFILSGAFQKAAEDLKNRKNLKGEEE